MAGKSIFRDTLNPISIPPLQINERRIPEHFSPIKSINFNPQSASLGSDFHTPPIDHTLLPQNTRKNFAASSINCAKTKTNNSPKWTQLNLILKKLLNSNVLTNHFGFVSNENQSTFYS